MMNGQHIKIYDYADAPKWAKAVNSGGDEDYLIILRTDVDTYASLEYLADMVCQNMGYSGNIYKQTIIHNDIEYDVTLCSHA